MKGLENLANLCNGDRTSQKAMILFSKHSLLWPLLQCKGSAEWFSSAVIRQGSFLQSVHPKSSG